MYGLPYWCANIPFDLVADIEDSVEICFCDVEETAKKILEAAGTVTQHISYCRFFVFDMDAFS